MSNLKECYEELGGNYDNALKLLRSEALLQKFVLKFLNDKSFELLTKSLAENNAADAFRAAHTIKGVCQNLYFDRLFNSSHELAELLRPQDINVAGIPELYERVKEDYAVTRHAIEGLQ